MIYLATPYSHPKESVRNTRYLLAIRLVHLLMTDMNQLDQSFQDEVVYSPIVHWHPIARRYKLPEGHEFWRSIDEQMIDLAHSVMFAMVKGWEASKGMKREYHYALVKGKNITRLELRHDCALIISQRGPLYE